MVIMTKKPLSVQWVAGVDHTPRLGSRLTSGLEAILSSTADRPGQLQHHLQDGASQEPVHSRSKPPHPAAAVYCEYSHAIQEVLP